MFFFLQFAEGDLFAGFIRSLVSCATPVPDSAGHCPVGSTYSTGACLPVPSKQVGWSGSGSCADRQFVVGRGVAIGGQTSAVGRVCQLLGTYLIAPVLDSRGRKPIIVLSFVGWVISMFLFWVSCFFESFVLQLLILFVATIIGAVTNIFNPASQAMVADLTTEEERGTMLSALTASKTAGLFCAFTAGFFVLSEEVENYRDVWLVVLLVSVVALALTACLEESFETTVQHDGEGDHTRAPRRTLSLEESVDLLRLLIGDRFLVNFMCIQVLVCAALFGGSSITFGFGMTFLGWSQAKVSIVGVVLPPLLMVGYWIATRAMARVGPHVTFAVGLGFFVVSFICTFLVTVVPACAEALFWLGVLFRGLSYGLASPASDTILSLRAGAQLQGRIFSWNGMFQTLGSLVGMLIWTNVLWRNGAQGWHAGVPWFVSTLVSALSLVWFCMLHWQTRTASTRSFELQEGLSAL